MQNKEDDSRIIKARTHTIAQGTYVIIESGAVNASYLVDSVESAAEDMMEHAKTLRDQAERALRRADLCKKAAGVLIRENTHQEESGEDSADAAIQSVGKVSADMIEKARADGRKIWLNAAGELHREGGPAVDLVDGDKEWCRNGRWHREDGPAVVCIDGTKFWYQNGLRHRDDGPAIVRANGDKLWFREGKLHREDGPAVENGDGTVEYWIDDKQVDPPKDSSMPKPR